MTLIPRPSHPISPQLPAWTPKAIALMWNRTVYKHLIQTVALLRVRSSSELRNERKAHNNDINNNLMIVLIVIIIMITLTGTIRDFLQFSHCAANCLQHACSSGQAQRCANHVQHIGRLSCVLLDGDKRFFALTLGTHDLESCPAPHPSTSRPSHTDHVCNWCLLFLLLPQHTRT